MKSTNIYQYLESTGVLDTGSADDIERQRLLYWKKYKREWRQQQRRKLKSFTVYFDENMTAIIKRASVKQKMSCTKYIQQSALLHAQGKTITVNPNIFNYIREALMLNYHAIKDLEDGQYISPKTEREFISTLAVIEKKITAKLNEPAMLEDAIKEAIQNDPDYKNILHEILKNI